MRSIPQPGEQYEVNHQNVIMLHDHVLMFGFNKTGIYIHFHSKGRVHHQTHEGLIRNPPIDIIKLGPEDVQLLLERLVWADAARETTGSTDKQ